MQPVIPQKTAEDFLAEAEKWERIYQDTHWTDPSRRIAQENIDFFLNLAASKERSDA